MSLRGPAGAVAISQDCSEFQENLGEFETFYRRFPRRFAPRNDKAEALCHTEDTPMFSLFSSLRNLRLIRFFDTQTQKRNVPPGKPDGQLVKKSLRVFCQAASKLQNFFVVLFCNFAAAAGDQTRKDTLTVSFQLVEKSLRAFCQAAFRIAK